MKLSLAWAALISAVVVLSCSQPSSGPVPTPSPAPGDARPIAPARGDVPPPLPVDNRTAAQIALAACQGADGSWRCPDVPAPRRGATQQPIIPPSWTVPAWDIDPANATGCASDTNSGTTATCGTNGVGPLLTYQELLVHRWGCFGTPTACPRLRQTTSVTFLSSQSNNADPVTFAAAMENGVYVTIQGALPSAACSGTLSNVTAKNRATPQLLQAQVGSCTLSPGQMLVNSTHASRAFVNALVSGSIYSVSQPLAPNSATSGFAFAPAEVDTWANGDSVAAYNLVNVNIASVQPMIVDDDAAFVGGMFVTQLNAWNPAADGLSPMHTGEGVLMFEAGLSRVADVQTASIGASSTGFFNVYNSGGIVGGSSFQEAQFGSGTTILLILGGVLQPQFLARLVGGNLDGDLILGAPNQISLGGGRVGFVYIGSGKTLDFVGTTNAVAGSYGGNSIIWGPGALNVMASARAYYTAGASKAAATFLQTGGFNANSQGKTCLGAPGAASAFATCNITLSAANLDTNLGATSGCLAAPGGGSVCNYGP